MTTLGALVPGCGSSEPEHAAGAGGDRDGPTAIEPDGSPLPDPPAGGNEDADGGVAEACPEPPAMGWTGDSRIYSNHASMGTGRRAELTWVLVDSIGCLDRYAPEGEAFDFSSGQQDFETSLGALTPDAGELVIDRRARTYTMRGFIESGSEYDVREWAIGAGWVRPPEDRGTGPRTLEGVVTSGGDASTSDDFTSSWSFTEVTP